MKSPRAMRYKDLMESATTRGGLPVDVIGFSMGSLISQHLAAIPGTPLKIFKEAPHGLYAQRRRKFDRVALEFLDS